MSSQPASSSRPTDTPEPAAKRVRLSSPPAPSSPTSAPSKPVSLHSWLHPTVPPPLMCHSPPLHAHTSTFLSFSIAYTPPSHIRSAESMAKDVRRVVRELDVPSLVGDRLLRDGDGAFQDGEGRKRVGGKEKVREPDHRMWAARAVGLGEGRDGTAGEDDYQLIECMNDDGEKYGGDRVLKVMKELGGVDVITICCRWYGGDMLGPIRFQHIGTTAHTSLTALQKLVKLTDLRSALVELDSDIAGLRSTISAMDGKSSGAPLTANGIDTSGASGQPADGVATQQGAKPKAAGTGTGTAYDKIDDVARLQRLVNAKEKTRAALENKAAWAGAEMGAEEVS